MSEEFWMLYLYYFMGLGLGLLAGRSTNAPSWLLLPLMGVGALIGMVLAL